MCLQFRSTVPRSWTNLPRKEVNSSAAWQHLREQVCASCLRSLGPWKPCLCSGSPMNTFKNSFVWVDAHGLRTLENTVLRKHELGMFPNASNVSRISRNKFVWRLGWPWAIDSPFRVRCPPFKTRHRDVLVFQFSPRVQRPFPEDSTQESWPLPPEASSWRRTEEEPESRELSGRVISSHANLPELQDSGFTGGWTAALYHFQARPRALCAVPMVSPCFVQLVVCCHGSSSPSLSTSLV